MANQSYPNDAKDPIQTLTFLYEGGGVVYFYLQPKPDDHRERVATVDITYEMPGWPNVVEIPNEPFRTVMEAGVLSYAQAQTEGQAKGKKITEAWIDGREFLTPEDLENIVGRAFPVILK